MVFTQRPLSFGESFGYERRNASVTLYSDGDSGTPSFSVQATNLWYDIRDTYIVRFVADGCRKNLPLGGRDESGADTISLRLTLTPSLSPCGCRSFRIPVGALRADLAGLDHRPNNRFGLLPSCPKRNTLQEHSLAATFWLDRYVTSGPAAILQLVYATSLGQCV